MSLQSALAEATKRKAEQDQQEIQNKLIDFHASVYGFAATYDNIVVLAGYGAFFALWASINQDLTIGQRLISAALIGVSLTCYVGWHIAEMLMHQKHEYRKRDVFDLRADPTKFNEAWLRVDREEAVFSARLTKFLWFPLFVPVVLGLAGGIYLSYSAVERYISLNPLT